MTKREFQLFDRVRVRARHAVYRTDLYPSPQVGVVVQVVTRLDTCRVYVHYPDGRTSMYYPKTLEHADDEA